MARNRQRAKQRQAERRAARQAARDNSGAVPDAQRRVEAPPEELGQSGYTLEHTNEAEEFIGDLEIGDEEYPGRTTTPRPRRQSPGRAECAADASTSTTSTIASTAA